MTPKEVIEKNYECFNASLTTKANKPLVLLTADFVTAVPRNVKPGLLGFWRQL